MPHAPAAVGEVAPVEDAHGGSSSGSSHTPREARGAVWHPTAPRGPAIWGPQRGAAAAGVGCLKEEEPPRARRGAARRQHSRHCRLGGSGVRVGQPHAGARIFVPVRGGAGPESGTPGRLFAGVRIRATAAAAPCRSTCRSTCRSGGQQQAPGGNGNRALGGRGVVARGSCGGLRLALGLLCAAPVAPRLSSLRCCHKDRG